MSYYPPGTGMVELRSGTINETSFSNHERRRQASYTCPLDFGLNNEKRGTLTTRRSMASLRLPVSRFSVSTQSTQTTCDMSRSHSSSSYRRSVAGMTKLLPLKLQSAPASPIPSVTAWLNETVVEAPLSACEPQLANWKGEFQSIKVPWMHSPQEERFFNDLLPHRYRETPIYSEPGSPRLIRAYFNDEDLCNSCPPPGSACEESCIVDSYRNSKTSFESLSQDSFAGTMETSDGQRPEGSIETTPTSVVSSRLSTSSFQCIETKIPICEGAWMSGKAVPRLAAGFGGRGRIDTSSYTENCWIESESSDCGSRASSSEPHDALVATSLAPASFNVVHVPAYPELPSSLLARSTSLPRGYDRPSTPFRKAPRRLTTFDTSIRASRLKRNSPRTSKIRGRKSRVPLPTPRGDVNIHTPPHSPLDFSDETKAYVQQNILDQGSLTPERSQSPNRPTTPPLSLEVPLKRRFSSSRSSGKEDRRVRYSRMHERSSIQKSTEIIDSIRDAIAGFPSQMLFLENPCVVDIRRSNQETRVVGVSHSVSAPSLESMDQGPPLRRRSKAASLFAPRRRRAATDEVDTALFLPTGTSQHSLTPAWIEPSLQVVPADLRSLQSIFPDTDDWWRGILYAHLVAYNYVSGLQQTKSPSLRHVPSKAAARLGIVQDMAVLDVREEEVGDEILRDVLDGLAFCINRVTNCMAGTSLEVLEKDAGSRRASRKVDYTIVKALALVVKACETV